MSEFSVYLKWNLFDDLSIHFYYRYVDQHFRVHKQGQETRTLSSTSWRPSTRESLLRSSHTNVCSKSHIISRRRFFLPRTAKTLIYSKITIYYSKLMFLGWLAHLAIHILHLYCLFRLMTGKIIKLLAGCKPVATFGLMPTFPIFKSSRWHLSIAENSTGWKTTRKVDRSMCRECLVEIAIRCYLS